MSAARLHPPFAVERVRRGAVLSRKLSRVPAAALMLVSPWFGSTAHAQTTTTADGAGASITKPECAQAFEQSQRLRNAFRYVDATAEALKCANPACGAALAEECGKLYGELKAETPSVVVGARDQDGNDLANATVQLGENAKPLAVDGTPLPIDPGNHELIIAATGFEPVVQRVVIRAGEQLRPIVSTLQRVSAKSDASVTKQNDEITARSASSSPPLATYILGGVALAGFAGFAGFRIAGAHDYDTLSKECKPTCSQSSIDAARNKYIYSDIALAVGLAAAAAAVTIYVAAPKEATPAAIVQIRGSGDGLALRLSTAF